MRAPIRAAALWTSTVLIGPAAFAAPCFDHGAFDAVLRANVSQRGEVNYAALQAKPEGLKNYLAAVAITDVSDCTEAERMAFWINAYNANVLNEIMKRPDLEKIGDDPKIFEEKLKIAQLSLSLNDVRDRVIRSAAARGGPIPGVSFRQIEPLAHFGLCDGAIGSPKLRRRAYTARSIWKTLQANAAEFVNDPVNVAIVDGRLRLPTLFKTYAFSDDFKNVGGVPAFIATLTDAKERPDADEIDARLKTDFPRRVTFVTDRTVNRVRRMTMTEEEQPMLSVGDKAPDFKLRNDEGKDVSLKDFKGKNLVLYFYPKDDTPGCTTEACSFRDSEKKFRDKNAVIVGVSADSVESHVKFKTKYGLPFQLLSDPDKKMLQAYGVWKEKSMYGKKYMGIERTTFIIDGAGRIVKIFPKVSVTGHVEDVLNSVN